MGITQGSLFAAFALIASSFAVLGAETPQGPVFTLIEENDLVVKTDHDYTQGIKLSYLHTDNVLPGFLRALSDFAPTLGFEKEIDKWGLLIGQTIFTPKDTERTELIVNDRPYAGWLYGGIVLQRRGTGALDVPTLEQFQLQLGIIGPESLAEQAQTWLHEIRNFDVPQGWDNQLKNEPGVALTYYRTWRVPLVGQNPHPRYADFLPHVGWSLGNVETSLRLGMGFRAGYNLPEDYGPQTISSLLTTEGGLPLREGRRRSQFSAYVFADAEGGLLGYSTFLDGNILTKSHSVERGTFVNELRFGAVMVFRYAEVGLLGAARAKDYATQSGSHEYGSVYLKVKW